MENCLVIKLKGTVSGNLPFFGEAKLEVKHADTVYDMVLRVEVNSAEELEEISVRTDGGSITELTPGAKYKDYLVGNGIFDIYVRNKYLIKNLMLLGRTGGTVGGLYDHCDANNMVYMSSSDLQYCSNLKRIEIIRVYGDISQLSLLQLTGLRDCRRAYNAASIQQDKFIQGDIANLDISTLDTLWLQDSSHLLTGNLSIFQNAGFLRTLNISVILAMAGRGLQGNIVNLINCRVLTEINFSNTLINGSLESLIEGQCGGASPRTSGGLSVPILNSSYLTFKEKTFSELAFGWCLVEFSATGASILNRTDRTITYATYTKNAANPWYYNPEYFPE